MVPSGHCNWFWRRLLYNYWIESSSNGNSISKGKSAAISKKILEQLCFSFKTIISYSTKQAILNFTKGCKTSSYKLLLLQQYSAISWCFLQKEMPELPGQVTTGVGFETGLYTTIELKILPRAVLFQRVRQQQIPQCSLNSFVSPSKPLLCSTKYGNSELHQGMHSILLKIVFSAAVLFLMFFA